MNEIITHAAAKNKLLVGASKLAEAVVSTLGPKGLNVIIEQDEHNQLITKDGVTVAKAITFSDRAQNIGAQLMAKASLATNEKCGDGTTTACAIAYELLNQGMSLSDSFDALKVKHGIEEASKEILNDIKKNSICISTFKEIENVAAISANNDRVIGQVIAKAMEAVGKDGIITIEESNSFDTALQIVDGCRINKGFISHYFVTNKERNEIVYDSPLLLITNKQFLSMADIVPILEAAAKQRQPLLLICREIDGEALNTMVINNARGIVKCCAIRAPLYGEKQNLILEDLSIITNGHFFNVDIDREITLTDKREFGTAKRVIVSRDTTTIIDGKSEKSSLLERVNLVKELQKSASHDEEIFFFKERLGMLTGGIAIIKIGSHTEISLLEKVARVEDALNATQAAVEDGIIPGGGIALYRAAVSLEKKTNLLDKEINAGYKALIEAAKAPFRIILRNAGKSPELIERKLEKTKYEYGFNPLIDEIQDFLAEGIIDPAKVACSALENAVSVVKLALTTNALIIKIDEQQS